MTNDNRADRDRDEERAALPAEPATWPPTLQSREDVTLPPGEEPASPDDATIPPQSKDSFAATMPLRGTSDAPAADSCVGRFGDYELLEEIARGGMGVVYKARQTKLNRIVALKMILAGQLAGKDDVQRFHAEAEAAANLDHPGIVPIYEVGEHEGQHYFSMGFVDGQSLADKLHAGPLPSREAAKLTKKVAEAIEYAHQRGVVHRDLKPANVLLDSSGEPRVTDFGLAKRIDDDSGLTKTGDILGTPAYMSPEQASGRIHEVTHSADVYALGAILYALLTGRAPFEATSPIDTLLQVLESEATLPTAINRRTPRPLELICMKCLEKSPAARYSTADELCQDLDRFLHDEPIEARPTDIWQRLRRWSRRQPALVAHLIGLTMILILIQITYLLIGTDLAYHLRHTGVLVLWIFMSLVLQQVMNRPGWLNFATSAWAITDTVLFTTLLYQAAPPRGPLLIGYPLLIVASGLFFRSHLVIVTTVACALTYGLLLFLRPELATTPHYCVIFEAVLIILGGIVMTQVERIKRLNQYFERYV